MSSEANSVLVSPQGIVESRARIYRAGPCQGPRVGILGVAGGKLAHQVRDHAVLGGR